MPVMIQLPNGLEVYALNAQNALLVYDDVFVNQVYWRHGISVRDGDCVFDVGANIGLFLIQLNQMLRHGRVFAFEPVPEIFKVLGENVRIHNRLKLRLFNHGLAKKTGFADFAFFPKSPADSSMFPDDSAQVRDQQRRYVMRVLEGKTTHLLSFPIRMLLAITPGFLKCWIAEHVRRWYMTSRTVSCAVRNLSDVIDELGVQRIDLLKMDVEGAEFDILAGLRPEHWPRIGQIVVEVHGGPAAAGAMCQLLERHGLSVFEDSDPIRPNNFMIYAGRVNRASTAAPLAATDQK
jgi:FkbM family methyltransferase